MNIGPPAAIFLILFFGFLIILPCWKILSKAGLPPIMSLLVFVPVINIGLLYFVAFTEWPALRQRKE
jgi:hypothetical protein